MRSKAVGGISKGYLCVLGSYRFSPTSVRPYLSTADCELTLVISRDAKGQHIWRVNRKGSCQKLQVGTICHCSRLSREISEQEEFQNAF